LADVALIDARTAAAVGGLTISWWHAKVAAGIAPRPAIQQPRFTRWRLADVRLFWQNIAEQANPEATARLKAQANKAQAAAQARRRAAAGGHTGGAA
jgi:hypothetical protein